MWADVLRKIGNRDGPFTKPFKMAVHHDLSNSFKNLSDYLEKVQWYQGLSVWIYVMVWLKWVSSDRRRADEVIICQHRYYPPAWEWEHPQKRS